MIYKLVLAFCLLYLNLNAQKREKKDLYLYFKVDSSKVIYKKYLKIGETKRLDKKIDRSETKHDIYTYSYISSDVKRDLIYDLFASINKNNFCITDSSILKKKRVLPYQNLEKIKGLISDEWNQKNFKYKRVFIVEKLAENQFKSTQVQLYFPFTSHGFRTRDVGSKETIVQP
ncbi:MULTISPECIES: hypothetical protein [unclassified Pedobacter]|uniref:hypothetical protein n=1 Tax=unclassified Pedobacter TaxID=2628915 RepID=UPI001E4E0EE8|nr:MULTISPECIES: hypothetical protein [unclassified Pedobacter]